MVAGRSDIAWRDRGFLELTGGDGGSRKKSVALISGGGSGHEPLHAGFLGAGMLHAVCPGHIFTSPNARQILEATRAVDDGSGVVHIVKNYTGDVMNFGVAAKLAAEEGIRVETVLVGDDVATDLGDRDGGDGADGEGGGSDGPGRRDTGATILVEKACGAAAARGADVGVVADVGRNVARRARSIAMSLSGAHTPGSEESFSLEEDEAEFGVGIHGDFGVNMRAALGPFDLPLRGTVGDVLHSLGESYLVRAGGTSGAVFGLFFATMGAAAGDAKSIPDADVAAAAGAGLDAIVELGGAKVGDGTVVDAIAPAVGALESGADLAGAAEKAVEGADATAARVAGKGRASYVGDAAKGVADPGALVMGWFFEELAR